MIIPTKLVFTGSVGAGKSTAVSAVSRISPIRTEVQMYDGYSPEKTTTTVGVDYGEVALGDGRQIRIFGTPGQRHFDFVCRTVGKAAQGCVILLDYRHPSLLGELRYYSGLFGELPQVVGITHGEDMSLQQLQEYRNGIAPHIPVFPVDAREPNDILRLIHRVLCS